jgi:hypothetical protein
MFCQVEYIGADTLLAKPPLSSCLAGVGACGLTVSSPETIHLPSSSCFSGRKLRSPEGGSLTRKSSLTPSPSLSQRERGRQRLSNRYHKQSDKKRVRVMCREKHKQQHKRKIAGQSPDIQEKGQSPFSFMN